MHMDKISDKLHGMSGCSCRVAVVAVEIVNRLLLSSQKKMHESTPYKPGHFPPSMNFSYIANARASGNLQMQLTRRHLCLATIKS